VAIDPDRAGIGGLRLQLELALFAAAVQPRPTLTLSPPDTTARPVVDPTPMPQAKPAKAQTASEPVITSSSTTGSATAEPEAAGSRAARPPEPAPAPAASEPAPTERADIDSGAPGPEGPGPVSAAPAPTRSDATEPVPTELPAGDVPAPGPTGSAGGSDATGEVQRLVGDWSLIVKGVSPATRAVLAECRPISIEGNTVTLGFPETKAFLKDHAERRRQDVEAAIGTHLGRAISVRTVATNIEIAPLVGSDDLVAEARRIFGEDLVDVGEVT
jgi:hypothetical protein